MITELDALILDDILREPWSKPFDKHSIEECVAAIAAFPMFSGRDPNWLLCDWINWVPDLIDEQKVEPY